MENRKKKQKRNTEEVLKKIQKNYTRESSKIKTKMKSQIQRREKDRKRKEKDRKENH